MLNHPRSAERPGNYIHSKLHHLRPLCSRERSWLGEMLRVQLSPLRFICNADFSESFLAISAPQTDELLSACPAGLIGFVFSTACFRGCPPPEHVLDKPFPSQLYMKIPTNPQSYKGPLLPDSKKGKLLRNYFPHSASYFTLVMFCRSCQPLLQNKE